MVKLLYLQKFFNQMIEILILIFFQNFCLKKILCHHYIFDFNLRLKFLQIYKVLVKLYLHLKNFLNILIYHLYFYFLLIILPYNLNQSQFQNLSLNYNLHLFEVLNFYHFCHLKNQVSSFFYNYHKPMILKFNYFFDKYFIF